MTPRIRLNNRQAEAFRSQRKIPAPLFALLMLACLAQGCTKNSTEPVPSTNLAALTEIVDLGIPVASVRYEIFSTPESDRSVPGPSDYVTLIAELEVPGTPPPDPTKPNDPPDREFALVPRAGRPWLSEAFKSMLRTSQNNSISLLRYRCTPLSANLHKTHRPRHGFSCREGHRLIVYLVVADDQGSHRTQAFHREAIRMRILTPGLLMIVLVATLPIARANPAALRFADADGGTLCLQPVNINHSRLRRCGNAHDTISLDAKAAALLSRSTEIVPNFSSSDGHQTRLTILLRTESNTANRTGFCGAGYEDHIVLIAIDKNRATVRDTRLIRSCLESLSISADNGGDDAMSGINIDKRRGSVTCRWLSDPDNVVRTISVSESRFVISSTSHSQHN